MTVVDAPTALPYLGDDPAQVIAFQEGVSTARGHLLSYSADLGAGRKATTAAWRATEADLADTGTADLLTAGQAVTSSLEAGNSALGVYLEILNQGRRTVDGLRAEWDATRSQATELETRPLATIEDETTAKADAARLTDQFQEIQSRFSTVVSTIETAANDCSRALNAAVNTPDDSGGIFSTISYDDPLGPDSDDPLGPEVGVSSTDRWWEGDNSLRHNAVVRAVRLALQSQLAGPDGKLAGRLGTGLQVPGGSKFIAGNPGYVDLYYDDGTTVWIWEIKGTVHDDHRLRSQQELASSEAATYVEKLNENPNRKREYKVGEPLDVGLTVDYTTLGSKDEIVTVDNAPKQGGGIYYRTDEAPPAANPPAPQTRDPFDLSLPLNLNSPSVGERLSDINDALNAPSYIVGDSMDRSAERLRDAVLDELNPFDGKDESRISTAVDESAEDIANSIVESIDGIANALSPPPDN